MFRLSVVADLIAAEMKKSFVDVKMQSPADFKRDTEVSSENSDHILKLVKTYLNDLYETNLNKAKGVKPSMLLEDRVALTLYYLRQYLTFLSHLNAGEGYVVVMNNPGLLKITGLAADFSNYTFPTATGWHLIGNPFSAFQKFENVFSSETCDFVKYLEDYWSPDGVYSDHKCFEPGKGYYLLNK